MGRSGLLATCSEDKLRDDVLLVSEDMLLTRPQSWTKPMEPFKPSLQQKEREAMRTTVVDKTFHSM